VKLGLILDALDPHLNSSIKHPRVEMVLGQLISPNEDVSYRVQFSAGGRWIHNKND